jgi:hypothetical protein
LALQQSLHVCNCMQHARNSTIAVLSNHARALETTEDTNRRRTICLCPCSDPCFGDPVICGIDKLALAVMNITRWPYLEIGHFVIYPHRHSDQHHCQRDGRTARRLPKQRSLPIHQPLWLGSAANMRIRPAPRLMVGFQIHEPRDRVTTYLNGCTDDDHEILVDFLADVCVEYRILTRTKQERGSAGEADDIFGNRPSTRETCHYHVHDQDHRDVTCRGVSP